MGVRSGLGVVELAILAALDSVGARPGRGFFKSGRALALVEESIGLGPGYAYRVLVDLAQPWTVPVPLVSGHGNLGSRANDPPANFRYTKARISAAGAVVLAAERGESAPVPVGLINGNIHQEGTRPPFRPAAVLAALREVISHPDLPDQELTEIVGPPVFPTGHTGRGDLAALAVGRETKLRLEADITISDDGRNVMVENIPYGATTDDVAMHIADRAKRQRRPAYPGLSQAEALPIADFRDETDMRHPNGRFVCVVAPGTAPEEVRDRLLDIYGVYTIVRAKLPRLLPAMIRAWVTAHGGEDIAASLTALEQAL
jgi:DNA gyrase/topoisomerase IV subunit A